MLTLDAMLTSSSAPSTAIAVFVAFQIASWLYEYFSMPAEARKGRKYRKLPGWVPFFHDTFTIARNAHRLYDFMVEHGKNGDDSVTRWKVLGTPSIYELATPEHLEDIEKTHFECFIKGPYQYEGFEELLGHGIFNADGANWVHQRKTAVNLFSTRVLRDQMSLTAHHLIGVLNGILQKAHEKNEPADLADLLSRFTLQAFSKNGFGIDIDCLGQKETPPFMITYDRVAYILTQRFLRPVWFWKFQRWANIGLEAELKKNMRVVNDTIFEVITKSLEERNKPTNNKSERRMDIISLFLDCQKKREDGTIEPFDPIDLRDITINFLGAARDTTAVTMSWFFYELSRHPEVERKLRQEIHEKLPDLAAGKVAAPSMEQVSDLVYMEAVIKETLRLDATVPNNIRYCTKACVLSDGTYIPKGATVGFQNYKFGRMEYIWGPDAEEFKPERWIDENTGKIKAVSPFKFNAFLGGPRVCLGMHLALMQIKMVAASVLSKFHFESVSKDRMMYEVAITLIMKDPLMMRVHPAAEFT